jgi:lysophospholipase L1-like esterase
MRTYAHVRHPDSRRRRRARQVTVKRLAVIAGSVCAFVVLLEAGARLGLGYKPLLYSRPYDPLYVSGDFFGEATRAHLANAPGGPESFGYQSDVFGNYIWNGRPAVSATGSSDFLFSNQLSRYRSADVDRIVCSEPDSIALYVLGGSVAVGTAASSKETSWHALLEGMLRRDLQRGDLYVFNAAMGAFSSFQEREAYYFAVVPRAGDLILILDGYNDLLLPANSAARPGDPFQTGSRFSQFYGSYFLLWLAEHSALVNRVVESQRNRAILQYRSDLNTREPFFREYANAAASLYVENIVAILKDCDLRKAVCLVAIQPSEALSASYAGAKGRDVDILPPEKVRRLYELLFQKIGESGYADRFIDLTHAFDAEGDLRHFRDAVHPDDTGQRIIADRLLPRVAAAAKAVPRQRRDLRSRCAQIHP